MISLMAAPFVVCILLVAIHGYFGLHVIARGVIFVDLALAQMAALGATAGLLLRIAPDSVAAQLLAVAATGVGAAIFAVTRTMRVQRVPHEAIIGIVYVVGSAAAMLIADQAPRGAEHIKDALVGTILWVTWPTVLKDAIAYSVIGILLVIFRRRFEMISFDPAGAARKGLRVRAWDFLFYLLFGVTVTFSVPIAGVLLVFTFLVVPAVIAFLFFKPPALAMPFLAWATGALACTLGLWVSYASDLPTGPVIVCTFGAVLLLAAVVKWLFFRAPAADAAA
jgi:zinc/manganese transport system permease protein